MTALIHAHRISLELPLDLQRTGGPARAGTLRASLGGRERMVRTILRDIDFRAEDGDRIGVLGLNGAGKTTLLRVLNGALPPTNGRLERRGSVQSLLNPTLGFEEYASVVENVFLRGTAMGLRRTQLRAALPGILGFAGLEGKASHPLHTLSSGQRMRLGFSISTAIQPDILLMDEWLSTGDAAFIDRAQRRMRERFSDSRIVVMASHSPALVRILCNKAIVLEDGRMRFFGCVEDALVDYRSVVSKESAELRRELRKADPLLFGDCTGIIERIRAAGPLVEIQGWAEDGKGGEVGVVCVELDGRRHLFDEVERVDREDVRMHLGRSRGRFGFRVVVNRGESAGAETVARRLMVSVGRSASELGAPLPLAHAAVIESAAPATASAAARRAQSA
jgi:ABC-type polysaccharide/polyol phosphate transport system ATPase subunit